MSDQEIEKKGKRVKEILPASKAPKKCPKCNAGVNDIEIKYRKKKSEVPEHLKKTCKKCGYHWRVGCSFTSSPVEF